MRCRYLIADVFSEKSSPPDTLPALVQCQEYEGQSQRDQHGASSTAESGQVVAEFGCIPFAKESALASAHVSSTAKKLLDYMLEY